MYVSEKYFEKIEEGCALKKLGEKMLKKKNSKEKLKGEMIKFRDKLRKKKAKNILSQI